MGLCVRTDATRFCPHCVVRFGRSERCPQCDERPLDLRIPARRREALEAIARGSLGREMHQAWPLRLVAAWINRAFLPACACAFLVGALQTHALRGGVAGAGIAVLAQIGLILLLLASFFTLTWVRSWFDLLRRPRRDEPSPSAPLVLLPPSPEVVPGLAFEGIARQESRSHSPLAHDPCIAYRLVGTGPLGPIDDGAATTFLLETEDGVSTRIEASRCTLEIPVTDTPRALRPDRELTRFLEDRGIFPERGPLHLAEGLLRDGDRVIVEGALAPMEESEGYRGRRETRVLRETLEIPLRIRRVMTENEA